MVDNSTRVRRESVVDYCISKLRIQSTGQVCYPTIPPASIQYSSLCCFRHFDVSLAVLELHQFEADAVLLVPVSVPSASQGHV